MLPVILASVLLHSPVDAPAATAQGQAHQTQLGGSPDVFDLGEVVAEGRPLEETVQAFVREVAAPARNRGLARWRNGICVGVANLQNDLSQFIADRVSTIAADVGLRAGAPGCTPSILVVAVSDANAFTPAFVEQRRRLFRVGGSGMDRGSAALGRFMTNDQPVRWWIVSAPVDAVNAEIAVRLPGQSRSDPSEINPAGDDVRNFAPVIRIGSATRLSTHIQDDTQRAFVIVDIDRLDGVSPQQLADYIAFVALAQIDPEADTTRHATILNVFVDPARTSGLTQWDRAYLKGLYSAVRIRKNLDANASEIIASIVSERRAMDEDDGALN